MQRAPPWHDRGAPDEVAGSRHAVPSRRRALRRESRPFCWAWSLHHLLILTLARARAQSRPLGTRRALQILEERDEVVVSEARVDGSVKLRLHLFRHRKFDAHLSRSV